MVCPGTTRPSSTRLVQAVRPVQGRVLAAASDKEAGALTRHSVGSVTYSASTPGNEPPKLGISPPRRGGSPSIQPPLKLLITRSPTAKPDTPSPTAAISPLRSEQGVNGSPNRA